MKKKKAFSLIEVLVFVTILTLFFIAAISVVTYLVSTLKTNEYKVIASHYAEEGLEWIRSQKEEDWMEFVAKDTSAGNGTTYCLKTLNWATASSCNLSDLFGTPSIFKREAVIAKIPGTPITQVDVQVAVSWQERGRSMSIPLKTVLKLWE
ncbi:hypothetical protein COW98_01170 [Candidatus Roizmanbacteria bacterium CG22_combo_CG10-13_8_21_14_all_35_9]|uniref:Type II secretion system protein n=4 Tax=Candidatus Roizmaniibacteriota TaxID=1752723 RepID=A0A2M8F2H0_9BACT|nr:MAG: hypothetical protein COX47_01320 [Candidatus Roizmanbacteria bacterium CG23_combo_of_CG06-09_8_20_14_all_35_49]PIP62950.1 MAG: hypothetical protein COW98_01170 [Candidatus Roizmanbacteria bacterium CG22_combo_CG10-13_8_21_14_all_35_9]PIY70805.1 MAG: hypothetical protein COY88_03540 [Candidatus Roizmanbacteria bacterium CG_4_10_14_0_8_um_filter_35_28]PJC33481.1 MAG: hypothetical protein CO048_03035 [Candidatus Roizmanbacteria bacterium CG_4_9_14_0_2_um_filter_35_15]PJC82503.1 MAG: hypoth